MAAVLRAGMMARSSDFEFPLLPARYHIAANSIEGICLLLDGSSPESWKKIAPFRAFEDDDGIWAVPVYIERSEDGSTDDVESHLRSAFEAEAFLRKKDGTRFDQNGGTSTLEAQPGNFGIEYLFVDAPDTLDDYELVVRIPAGLTRLPIEFSFRNLALP